MNEKAPVRKTQKLRGRNANFEGAMWSDGFTEVTRSYRAEEDVWKTEKIRCRGRADLLLLRDVVQTALMWTASGVQPEADDSSSTREPTVVASDAS